MVLFQKTQEQQSMQKNEKSIRLKWDIPINFTVVAASEEEAEALVQKVIKRSILRYGLGGIVDYEFFEFVSQEERSDY